MAQPQFSSLPVSEASDEGSRSNPSIISFCIWYRELDEDEDEVPPRKKPFITKLKDAVLNSDIVDYITNLANPLIDSSHARAMADVCSDPDSRRFEEGYERPKWYYGVYDLGVHRDFQGRGVAKRMMELGIEKAQEESLPIYLSASPAGVPLYRRFGFLTVGKWTWWPKQTEGWDVMQWDPSVPASVVVGGRRKGVEWDFSVMVWRNTSEDGNILTT